MRPIGAACVEFLRVATAHPKRYRSARPGSREGERRPAAVSWRMRLLGLLALSTFVVGLGCDRPRPTPPALDLPNSSSPASSTGLSSADVEKLEGAFAAAEKAHPGGFPPCGPGVKGPCSMKTTSEIGHIAGDAIESQGDTLPAALHGHGEALRGAWVAPDGTEFLAGYMYTGVPGPDTGVVYRRNPGGAWRIVYSKRENELGHVWGTSSKDVWVAGVKTLAHWDGTAWQEERIPMLVGSLAGIWGSGGKLFAVSSDWQARSDRGRIFRRDAHGRWTLDGHGDGNLHDVGGLGSLVLAVGGDGQILRRTRPGVWLNEGEGTHTNEHVYVASEHDIYVAGSKLLHSSGDGKWARVPLPITAQARTVWGRGSADVYAGTLGGLCHWGGTSWSKTAWTHEVGALSGNGHEVLVANQRM